MPIPNSPPPSQSDVVIAGGGVVGTACAYALARRGLRVCLVERDDIGAGTTRAAAAAALLQTKTSAFKLSLASESLHILDELQVEFADAGESFEYEHTGSLLAATDEVELSVVREMVAKLQGLGLEVAFVDGDEARRLMPMIGPAVIGASHSPRDAKINPLELVTAYAAAARRHGAQVCTFCEVTGMQVSGERVTGVETSRGLIQTETVVDASGVWAARLGELAGVDIPVSPLKGELLVTEPMPPMMRGTLIAARYLLSKSSLEQTRASNTPSRSVGVTLVQVDHGNFIVGSTRELAGFDRRSTYAGVSELCRQLVELAPRVAQMHLIRAYAGLRPITPDGMPVIGRTPGLPGFIIAAGHGGDGLVMSAVTARLVAEIITGSASPDELAHFAPERFSAQAAGKTG